SSREGLEDDELSQKARDVLAFLRASGATFLEDIAAGTRRLRVEVEEALWELVAAGRVTGDGFSGLRALLPAQTPRGAGARYRWYANWKRRTVPRLGAGRWAVLGAPPAPEDDRMEALARQYVRRYGV